VGATTVAANLAVELSNLIGRPGQVALVDLDFRFGQVATVLDVHPQYTVADLCDSAEQIDPAIIKRALVDHSSGVRVLARPNTFVQADSITAAHCASVLAVLCDMCDYVVADGPTRYDPGGQSVVDVADYNLLILQLLVTSVRNADRIGRELAQNGFNLERMHLVCNRHNFDLGILDTEQVEKTIGRPMFATIPDDWRSVSSAVNMGEPLCTRWARTKVREAIAYMALRIHAPERAPAQREPRRGGLLGKWLAAATGGRRPAARSSTPSASPATV
jgi:pilus assembly protein CpaE